MKAKQKEIIVLENFELPEVKTSSYINILKALKIESKKSLLVLGEPNKNVYLSSRNLKNSEVITTSELNTYKILNAVSLILVENSISDIEGILS